MVIRVQNLINYINFDHNANKLDDALKQSIIRAQNSNFSTVFYDVNSFILEVCRQLKINLVIYKIEDNLQSASEFTDKSYTELVEFFILLLRKNSYPEQAIQNIASSLASRAMLLRAFENPDDVILYIKNNIENIIK